MLLLCDVMKCDVIEEEEVTYRWLSHLLARVVLDYGTCNVIMFKLY